MVSRIVALKDIHVLIPGTCEYAPSHGKGERSLLIS